jgi:hypothetical protein
MGQPAGSPSLTTFLVERYWPDVDVARVRALLPRLDAAAEAMTREGTPVTHVASILMPVDQVLFSLVAAGDIALVRQLNERADLPADRIAEAVMVPAFDRLDREGHTSRTDPGGR